MTVMIVDDNPIGIEPVAAAITARLGQAVVLFTRVEAVTPAAVRIQPLDLALVDLSFRGPLGRGSTPWSC